ncbi:hypothetical protein B0T22DRAFT_198574 [Podospora appendiculata]|uniref:Uncharacterized protein n=1 Tax=Podospora appendiculata TaxID=314037 RepID=A0AAE0X3Y0_9PEZI|nr:hypothetical protein B0T22DRAFT_198574 [Podospora appendiculata]
MASSEILSQTLSSITAIKLSQITKQQSAFESKKRSLLDSVAAEPDTGKRARCLLEGAEKLPSMAANPFLSAANLKRFLAQADFDPAVAQEPFLRGYEAALRGELQVQSNKYEFASLYGQLVNEWIASGKAGGGDADGDAGFVAVGREEMHEQRATWEAYVFQPRETDRAAIRGYLRSVFEESSKDAKQALDAMVKSMAAFQRDWDHETHFDSAVLSDCIRGMLRGDLLTDEKKATLRDFLGNAVVLAEIVDVLNMRMATRATWAWDAPATVDVRRNLNGRYRFYLDEDLLQSIFIYYVGRRWAVQLREVLVRFAKADGVWKPDSKPMTKDDVRRRRFFLGETCSGQEQSVHANREEHFHDEILFDHLPDSMREVRGSYGGDETKEHDTRDSHVDVVQRLLHRIETEVLLQTRLGRDITVIRSDFKWFGPSIPHASIFAVLAYFGVNDEWMDFFQRALEAPLKFKEDPADSPPQIRRRGTPLSTPIADFFAETCEKAWSVVTAYAQIVGLDFNLEKTGCAQIPRHGATTTTTTPANNRHLPAGDVTWGFLKLDPATGRFMINQADVDKHIAELRLQLAACRSVFDAVQAWNIYGVRFFARNVGQAANCSSRAHVDSILHTFQRIQQQLFPTHLGGVGAYFKAMIASRFNLPGGDAIPDGYLYFPISMGGLGLQNPFIPLLLIREQVDADPPAALADYHEAEETEYRRAQDKFDAGAVPSMDLMVAAGDDLDDLRAAPFMGFDEFVRYRERTSTKLGQVYARLMREPAQLDVELKGEVKAALASPAEWRAMTGYDKWVVMLFHKDMIARFGGLNVVDKGLLPTGLMSMLRQSRFRWQG